MHSAARDPSRLVGRHRPRRLWYSTRVSDSFLDKYTQLSKLGPAEIAEIWRHYDRDGSGYIEAGPELDGFLTDMLRASGEAVTELRLRDFIAGVLEMFDINADGKLERSELEQLLATE